MPSPAESTARTPNPLGTEKISTLIRKFSVPAIISLLVGAIYNMVDQIFIGQGIGMLGIAATNVSFPLTTISTATALLLGVGGAANFNLKLGAGNRGTASDIAGNTLTYLALFGMGIGAAVLLFLQPLLVLFGATGPVMPYAAPYTAIIAPGIPFLIFGTGACALIRADGSPTYAMGCMVAGAVFNLVFDPVFLFVFGMGIEGIALATTLGQMLSCGIAAAYLLRRFKTVPLERRHLRPRLACLTAITALGMAPCVNQLAMTVVQIVMNNALRHYGMQSVYGSEIPLAAVGAISKINMLFLVFPIGIGQGNQPIISFNYGARRYHRVKAAYRLALAAAGVTSVGAWLLFQLFPAQLMTIFGESDALYLQYAVRYFRFCTVACFFNCLQPVTANFFTSIGKAINGVFISLTRQIIFLLPLILLLPVFWGVDGVAFAAPVADIAAAVTCAVLVRREMKKITLLQAQQTQEAGECHG